MYTPAPLTAEERIEQLEQNLEYAGDRIDSLQERIETMQNQVDRLLEEHRNSLDDGR